MKLTTTVYKYRPYAPLMIILLVLITLFLFFSHLGILGVPLLFMVAIFAAIRPKSIFSVRSVDDRNLVFTPHELIWGNLVMPVEQIEKLEIYIHAFDNFRYIGNNSGGGKSYISEYGDRNKIAFKYRNVSYDLTFFLGTFEHYDILVRIIQTWREKEIDFSARSAFSDSYIREQTWKFAQRYK
ncbi:MAG: hypothetical protein J7578_14210 [Chitinophagaceae bacterium]|nr:hypothetical protein [Chitinophagaceae bacterium]